MLRTYEVRWLDTIIITDFCASLLLTSYMVRQSFHGFFPPVQTNQYQEGLRTTRPSWRRFLPWIGWHSRSAVWLVSGGRVPSSNLIWSSWTSSSMVLLHISMRIPNSSKPLNMQRSLCVSVSPSCSRSCLISLHTASRPLTHRQSMSNNTA
jgi:hypothetical protein